KLAHVPLGWRPTQLWIRVRRYRCPDCLRVWRQDTTDAAAPRAKLSRHAVLWALKSVVIDRMSIARLAAGLDCSSHTVNDAVLAADRQLLLEDPRRFDGVAVIGVDEHCWRHTGRGSRYVTVIIDLTPVRDGTGPARLLDMVEGRSKQVFGQWLADRPPQWRQNIEVVAMDGFTGYKTASTEKLPDAVEVMDPFHVLSVAGRALDTCRQRVQQEIRGHRGRKGDPLYGARRTLRTGADLLSDKQQRRLVDVFAAEQDAEVKATWSVYQTMIEAYRDPDRARGREQLQALIAGINSGVPPALTEVRTLGRTLKRRASDILAYFDKPGTSNGPTEAINGRLEHLRGIALGIRNLTNYIARSLLEAGGFRPQIHPQL